uniref:Prolyl endopeptidase n=1 Tax=Parastrongyloides trichosuri TaxID=131310 RepID=A0A0N5A6V1_PARTI
MTTFYKKCRNFLFLLALYFLYKVGTCNGEEQVIENNTITTFGSTYRLNVSTYPEIWRNDTDGETFNCTKVIDPYRYLGNSTNENTTKFISQLNNISTTLFQNISVLEQIVNKTKNYSRYEQYEIFKKYGEYYYYLYNNGSQENGVLMRTKNYENLTEAEEFVNPNKMGNPGEYSIARVAFSPNGTIIAYSLSANGSDFNTVYFKYANGTNLTDQIDFVAYSVTTFVLNTTGFLYSKYPDTFKNETTGRIITSYQNHTLYFHKIGNNQSEDVAIVNSTNKYAIIDGLVSENGRYLFATFWNGASDQTCLSYLNLSNYKPENFTGILNMTKLFNETDANYEVIHANKDGVIIKTDKGAPFGKIIRGNFSEIQINNVSSYKTLVAEKNMSKLVNAWPVGKKFLVINYLENVTSRLYVYKRLNEEYFNQIPINNGTVKRSSFSVSTNETFFEFENEITPKSIYKVDLTNVTKNNTVNVSEIASPVINGFNRSEYIIEQVFYNSTNNASVPMFIFHHKDMKRNRSNPVLLEGYGGFGISITPFFSTSKLMFVKHFNGIYCFANIRGGSEFGEEWHQEGMLLNKQHGFDDFANAAKYLIENNYTNPSKLAITGKSNGGLLVAVVSQQHPELIGAAVIRGGVLDMIYYKNYTVGKFWMGEYGNPDNETQFQNLYKYSPLHNIRINSTGKQQWPSTLLITSTSDYRVPAIHTLKYTAQLYYDLKANASQFQTNPIVAYVEDGTGHGDMKSNSKAVNETSNTFSFLYQTLNLTFYEYSDSKNETR